MNTQDISPPAGMRWREVEYTGDYCDVFVARYVNGWQYRYKNETEWENSDSFHNLCVSDTDVESVWSLRTNPTEPLPKPAVDRNGGAWKIIRQFEEDAMLRGRYGMPEPAKQGDEATDALMLALAPHWLEFGALSGDITKTRTVTDSDIVQAFNSAFQAVGKKRR